jgi:hypothetical protein
VRALWDAYVEHGAEGFLSRVPEDAELRPIAGDGVSLRGKAEISAFLRRQRLQGGLSQVVAYRFEELGTHVLVTGTLRRFDREGFSDSQPAWVFSFRDGRLAQIVGHPSEARAREALAAAGAA